MSDFFDELMDEAASIDLSSVPSEKASMMLRDAAQSMFDMSVEVKALEQQLADKKKKLYHLEHKAIPDIMQQIGQDKIGLPDAGENGVDIELKPYYHANISSNWDEDRRKKAFDLLEKNGDGDLIRNVVIFSFTKGENEKVKAFLTIINDGRFYELLKEQLGEGVNDLEIPSPRVEQSIPWNTLTSYVKEQDSKGNLHRLWMSETEPTVDPVEVLGATIGFVAKIKLRKAK